MASYGSDSLETISQEGEVPQTRMKNARAVQDYFRRLIDNDTKRAFKRARVNGLVDGNPPYKQSALLAAGRADACNVNTGSARSMLENSRGSFYDLFSEAPGYLTCRTTFGESDDQKELFSNLISQCADAVLKKCRVWDYYMQVSQEQMVLHGCGPFFFENNDKVIPMALLCGDLKVPEMTPSDTERWEICGLQATYYPHELYAFIENEEAADTMGWDVEYTKKVIANAMDIRQQAGIQYEWEFYQQELKNNSLTYYDDSKIIRAVHMFWKEFDGTITHAIVERDSASGTTTPGGESADIQYLCLKRGRYKSFSECVHPMYFDHGNGGYHHSVTGLGVKMYSLMEYENRLFCNLCDKAFSPKILFKPTTTDVTQKFEMQRLGDMAVLPPGFDWQQTGVAGLMNDGIAMHQLIEGTLDKNLSTYTQGVPEQKSGNPVTKFEKQLQAFAQAALNKTQYNRYYFQMDGLDQEIFRRLSNPSSRDPMAKEFQKKCEEMGVPADAYKPENMEYVGATRVPGQGSAFLRLTAVNNLFEIAASFPEDGRQNLIQDKIACEAGQAAVTRYFPVRKAPKPNEQTVEASLQIAAMKIGVPPVVTTEQNPVTFAGAFLAAGVQALQSVQKGANPLEVLKFLKLCGPAIAAHLQRFANDPTRAEVHKAMEGQWQQLAKQTDQLQQMAQKMTEQQNAQQQKTQQAMSDQQIAQAKAKADIAMKAAKTKAQLQQAAQKHALANAQKIQQMKLADAKTAHEIRLSRMKSLEQPQESNA